MDFGSKLKSENHQSFVLLEGTVDGIIVLLLWPWLGPHFWWSLNTHGSRDNSSRQEQGEGPAIVLLTSTLSGWPSLHASLLLSSISGHIPIFNGNFNNCLFTPLSEVLWPLSVNVLSDWPILIVPHLPWFYPKLIALIYLTRKIYNSNIILFNPSASQSNSTWCWDKLTSVPWSLNPLTTSCLPLAHLHPYSARWMANHLDHCLTNNHKFQASLSLCHTCLAKP